MAQHGLSLPSPIEIEERDQAGQLVATYIADSDNTTSIGRVDVAIPKASQSYTKAFLGAFLPAGYPQSVTKDYLEYQIYDSLQAFSSSIAGLLSSRAVLEGVGVGDANASPTAALLLHVLQDSMGRIATILFAHKLGTSLEPECKMYRFIADIFNDAALVLDCLSPAFPKALRVVLLSFSSVLRALCGVAAGSSKASLSAHFATQGNLGELNAKDSSQETIISLLGMLAGSLVVSHITTPLATWFSLLILLFIHLGTNYLAVRAVSMRTLNRQRANSVYSRYLVSLSPKALTHIPGVVRPLGRNTQMGAYDSPFPTPESISLQERVFERDGVLRWQGLTIIGHCIVGVPFRVILDITSSPNAATGSYKYPKAGNSLTITDLLSLYDKESYILHFAPSSSSFPGSFSLLTPFWGWSSGPRFYIVFKATTTTEMQLKAWFQAFICAWLLYSQSKHEGQIQEDDSVRAGANRDRNPGALSMLQQSLQFANTHWPTLRAGLVDAGWDIETGALETRSGVRVTLAGKGPSDR